MTTPEQRFVSYAFQDLDRKSIKKYAKQYDGVDMSKFIGANENNFPFLIRTGDDFDLLFWNPYHGMMTQIDEDSVRAYAIKQYILQNAYPVFDSFADAEAYAVAHNWPRKPWPDDEIGSNNPMDRSGGSAAS
jgi:hypothetical protein